jgi:hypothetical protein
MLGLQEMLGRQGERRLSQNPLDPRHLTAQTSYAAAKGAGGSAQKAETPPLVALGFKEI